MKEKRQNYILELIGAYAIETQDELARLLRSKGFKVTQATISRDIKELRLVKVTDNGVTRYSASENHLSMNTDRMMRIFRSTVLALAQAGQLVIATTISGSAGAAAEILDNLGVEGIIGTIAGDNTIFIAAKDAAEAARVREELSSLAGLP